MHHRREILKLTLGSAASALAPAMAWSDSPAPDKPAPQAQAPTPPPPAQAGPPVAGPGVLVGAPEEFGQGAVVDLARALSKKGFKPVSSELPDPFRSLSYDQYWAIHVKNEARIWADQSLGFVVEPLHRGFQYNNPIQLNLVADGKAYKLIYDVKLFDFAKLAPSPKIGDIGFSGFSLLFPQGGSPQEVASFQGSNFFRAMADGQMSGILARALAIKTADPRGEETPLFRSIWIEKPGPASSTLIVHALIDSESTTGAFRFTIRPGNALIMDTECTLFPRTNIDNYGLAGMSATHLLGFMDHKKFDDYRPNVSEVCGVQMLTGQDEWIWRPVSNPETLQISNFLDDKPRGFGCLIRDRAFEDYADEDNHWERRPSLWIEPLGEWGAGGVELIEIPSQSDANDNILCFWRPKEPLKGGSEVSFAYRQFWCWAPPQRPDLARAVRSRSGSAGKHQRFFVEFKGDPLGDAKKMDGASVTLTAGTGSITMKRTFADRKQKSYHVLFELDPGGASSIELRLLLQSENEPISETWLYRWTPS